jgi:hypothetical protein
MRGGSDGCGISGRHLGPPGSLRRRRRQIVSVCVMDECPRSRNRRTASRRIAGSALLLVALTGCASLRESDSTDTDTAPAHNKTASGPSDGTSPSEDTASGHIKEFGFGQQDEYVWVTALVHNDSDVVGQMVTVHFNAMDADGELVASTNQVDHFSRAAQDLAVGTQLAVPRRSEIASVEATLLIEDIGAFSDEPFPEIPTTDVKVVKAPYIDSYTANFQVNNPTGEPLQNLGIGLICHNSGGKIIGGGVAFPELVPANGATAVEASTLTSGKPDSCDAYVGAPVF